jgi:hypothetical protein
VEQILRLNGIAHATTLAPPGRVRHPSVGTGRAVGGRIRAGARSSRHFMRYLKAAILDPSQQSR